MATIKSYSDLQQSKKLAEILPLESADMYWWYSGRRYYIEAMNDGDFNEKEGHVRAWSLAALLDVLPNYEINNFGDSIQLDVKNKALVTDEGETLLDLVVNMIIYLHELNLL